MSRMLYRVYDSLHIAHGRCVQVTLWADEEGFVLMLPEPVLDEKPGVWDPAALHQEGIFFADVFTWTTKYRLAHAKPIPAPEAVPEWEAEPEVCLRFKKCVNGCAIFSFSQELASRLNF